ncbi:hypothetical protein [Hyperthermus butylicus]|uniref:SWIM-type domain-containing protein n=1 Tax=Hyperthermus butylicus (strain DSM 5456 / JCM 9403 / PLM1-5) TaxID=415426 RepID=A2BLS2_HYPBU|nr:hypothetical protein [Hyperthermus butylicus]ABM80933.1 hypothetical protein Hbut_1090 [Hyperthermus butylicus DSM 5456]
MTVEARSGGVDAQGYLLARRLGELRDRLRRAIESPSPEARAAQGELRVVRLARMPVELWVVLGRESDYLVVPGTYCSCPHFMIHVLGMGQLEPCYHLVAVELARRTGRFHDLSETLLPEKLADIVLEIVAGARTVTLRRILYGFERSRQRE